MPRIGGGGGPVVPPGGAQGAQGAQGQKADFGAAVQKATQAQPSQAAQQAQQAQQQSELTGRVKDLAQRFASGKLNQKEATREFVSLVIEERFPHFKKKKKKKGDKDEDEKADDEGSPEERLEEAVTELIDRDPALARKLRTQFNKLSKAANKG